MHTTTADTHDRIGDAHSKRALDLLDQGRLAEAMREMLAAKAAYALAHQAREVMP